MLLVTHHHTPTQYCCRAGVWVPSRVADRDAKSDVSRGDGCEVREMKGRTVYGK